MKNERDDSLEKGRGLTPNVVTCCYTQGHFMSVGTRLESVQNRGDYR